MPYKGLWKLLPLVLISSFAHAGGDLHFAGYLKAGKYGVDDPDGDTTTDDNIAPAIKAMYDLEARGQRVFSALEYVSFSLDPEPDSVAQDVDGYAFSIGYERKFPLSRSIKLWLSGALAASTVDFTNRVSIASDGYLDRSLDDRSENYVSGSIGLDTYFAITDQWEMGLGLFADIPLGDGVKAAGLKLTVQRF